MLFRAFISARKSTAFLLIGLGLCVGALEAAFVFKAKGAFTGGNGQTWMMTLVLLVGIVTVRSAVQLAAAKIEVESLSEWVGMQRRALLDAIASREFPAHRPPYQGRLASALSDDHDGWTDGILAGLRCLAALAQALVLAPLLFLFSWKLALAALALAAPAAIASKLRVRILSAAGKRWSDSKAELTDELENYADGMEAGLGNGQVTVRSEALSAVFDRHGLAVNGWEFAKAAFPPALEWFFFTVLAALAVFASFAAAGSTRGDSTLGAPMYFGSLLPFGALLLLLYKPIREWARHYPVYLLGDQSWLRYRNLQDTLAAFPIRRPPEMAPGGLILLDGLRFGYAGTATVFDSLDLELDPAALTWISGRNGAGKSTLLKLLGGIESPQAGRVRLPAALFAHARRFAYLPQRSFLETDWLKWRLSFQKKQPEQWTALERILGLEEILGEMPLGNTDVTTNGQWTKALSGGERQRLCLARVFAAPAGYLLLDEPTTWLASGDREKIMGDLLRFWSESSPGRVPRGAAIVSHEPFLGEFCSRTLHLDALQLDKMREYPALNSSQGLILDSQE